MKYNKAETEISRLIKQVVGHGQDWIIASQVTHIPYDKLRERYCLLINLNVKVQESDRDSLLGGALLIAQTVIGSKCLTDEKAVEVSVWIDSGLFKSPKRVFRLSILDTAYTTSMRVKLEQLHDKELPGIACQWPLQVSP